LDDKEAGRIASQVKDSVQVDGNNYEIRKLSWRSLEKAAIARTIALNAQMRAMGGEVFREIADRKPADVDAPKTIEVRKEERYAIYDVEEVLVAGIERVNGKPQSRQWILDEIDEAAAKAVHRRILDLSLPPLEPGAGEAIEGKS
jgi:hypothetical protein